MTSAGFTSPACREIRQLLGVYVVGAIDPAERATVDEHLADCQACRDELASLAGLPALLSRVPMEEAERIALAPVDLPRPAEPSPELLGSLVRRVSARRRIWARRGVAAVAAAAVIAAGGAVGVIRLSGQSPSSEVARGWSPNGAISAVVDYSPTSWGTAMRIQVAGLRPGTSCQFYVVAKNGKWEAGSWTVRGSGPGYHGNGAPWYAASTSVAASSVRSFQLVSGGKVLVKVPAR